MDNSLSEYELLRQRNIRRNHEFLKSLGIPVPAVPPRLSKPPPRTFKAKRKTSSVSPDVDSSSESSDDSDEDWVPGSEEVRQRNKMMKRFIPDFQRRPQTVPELKQTKGGNRSKVRNGSVGHPIPSETGEDSTSAFEELGRLGEELEDISDISSPVPGKKVDRKKAASTKQIYQYATRGKRHFYCEAEVPDDDHYIFCEECQDLHYGDCPVHGPLQIMEDSNEDSQLPRARASLPRDLKIGKSSIPGAGLGVFSTNAIPKGVRFGPYKGRKMGWKDITDETNTSYMWEIVKDGKFSHFVDGQDEAHSNWMRFVNCSRYEGEQNLVSYQHRGEIYYRTYKPVSPGKELLVWYGESYAKDLGISTSDNHASTKRQGSGHRCEKCGKVYTLLDVLQKHKKLCCPRDASERKWKCETCGKRFTTSGSLKRHFRTHTGEKPYQCTQCERAFNISSNLTSHLRTHSGEKPYQCTQCERAFNISSNLTSHLRTHSGEKPYQCTQCDKAFNQSSGLTSHLRTHTGEKPHQCRQCDKAFYRSSHLTSHLRTHTGEKPYQCTQCGKAFNRSSHLTRHLRTHSGEKPYQCTQCGKAFNRSSHLTRHLRTHSGENPYQCTQCDKAFSDPSNLTYHLRTHTGEMPYQCTQCDKAFNRSGVLTKHLRIHTSEMPYQ